MKDSTNDFTFSAFSEGGLWDSKVCRGFFLSEQKSKRALISPNPGNSPNPGERNKERNQERKSVRETEKEKVRETESERIQS